MYESLSYEIILQRMMERVLSENPNIDTREGSIIYNALAPAAVELQNMYIQLDVILNETFADTATREYLIKRAGERGIIPYPATNATLKGEFNIDVPVGSRYSLEDLNYIVAEKISFGVFKLQCETSGIAGNENFGNMIPIEYINGLNYARLTELLIPGQEEEETEQLRKRYYDSLDAQAFGGNCKDYKEKTHEIPGVGGCKVYPVWNGGGTVKLSVIASDYSVPTQTLVDLVQTSIDPVPNHGEGMGTAPIGHVVAVVGVQSELINIVTRLTLQEGWSWDDVKPYAETAIDGYFKELAQSWEDEESLVVRTSQIETRLLALPGVIDVADTLLNGTDQNVILDPDRIPKRGSFNG